MLLKYMIVNFLNLQPQYNKEKYPTSLKNMKALDYLILLITEIKP